MSSLSFSENDGYQSSNVSGVSPVLSKVESDGSTRNSQDSLLNPSDVSSSTRNSIDIALFQNRDLSEALAVAGPDVSAQVYIIDALVNHGVFGAARAYYRFLERRVKIGGKSKDGRSFRNELDELQRYRNFSTIESVARSRAKTSKLPSGLFANVNVEGFFAPQLSGGVFSDPPVPGSLSVNVSIVNGSSSLSALEEFVSSASHNVVSFATFKRPSKLTRPKEIVNPIFDSIPSAKAEGIPWPTSYLVLHSSGSVLIIDLIDILGPESDSSVVTSEHLIHLLGELFLNESITKVSISPTSALKELLSSYSSLSSLSKSKSIVSLQELDFSSIEAALDKSKLGHFIDDSLRNLKAPFTSSSLLKRSAGIDLDMALEFSDFQTRPLPPFLFRYMVNFVVSLGFSTHIYVSGSPLLPMSWELIKSSLSRYEVSVDSITVDNGISARDLKDVALHSIFQTQDNEWRSFVPDSLPADEPLGTIAVKKSLELHGLDSDKIYKHISGLPMGLYKHSPANASEESNQSLPNEEEDEYRANNEVPSGVSLESIQQEAAQEGKLVTEILYPPDRYLRVKSLSVWLDGKVPAIVLMTSGTTVDMKKIATVTGGRMKQVKMADPIKDAMLWGYRPGTFPPFGHRIKTRALLDRSVANAANRHGIDGDIYIFSGSGAKEFRLCTPWLDYLRLSRAEVIDCAVGETKIPSPINFLAMLDREIELSLLKVPLTEVEE